MIVAHKKLEIENERPAIGASLQDDGIIWYLAKVHYQTIHGTATTLRKTFLLVTQK